MIYDRYAFDFECVSLLSIYQAKVNKYAARGR